MSPLLAGNVTVNRLLAVGGQRLVLIALSSSQSRKLCQRLKLGFAQAGDALLQPFGESEALGRCRVAPGGLAPGTGGDGDAGGAGLGGDWLGHGVGVVSLLC